MAASKLRVMLPRMVSSTAARATEVRDRQFQRLKLPARGIVSDSLVEGDDSYAPSSRNVLKRDKAAYSRSELDNHIELQNQPVRGS